MLTTPELLVNLADTFHEETDEWVEKQKVNLNDSGQNLDFKVK